MLIPLAPAIQHYAWGDPDVIPELFGLPRDGRPHAEAWLGAHPLAPSTAFSGHQTTRLDRVIADEPEAILGAEARARWGRLPFLLKILAAAQPLSIQVHPSKAQAEAGFARENAAGVPLDAPSRSYKDASDKPELLVALRPFHALAGFRAPDELRTALDALPELAELLPRYDGSAGSLRELTRAYFELGDAEIEVAQGRILARLKSADDAGAFGPERPEHWLLSALRGQTLDGPRDRGLLFVFLLKLVRLAPGQGLFLPAGVLHAYLSGAGIEVMASSDNVLRAGLTPKHVDRAELLRIVDFAHRPLSLVEGGIEDGVRRYRTPAREFELDVVELRPGVEAPKCRAEGPEILLALDTVETAAPVVRGGTEAMPLERGSACLVTDGTSYSLQASVSARLCRVRVPAP